MYTSTKRINKIGKNSKGVILPSEWCFSLGLAFGSDIQLTFDPVSRAIMLKPLMIGTRPPQNYNDPNDYTPQPRRAFPPSPLPTHTPAQWAKVAEHHRQGLIDHYELEQAMREQGLNPNNEMDVRKYNYAVKNRHLIATDFSLLPYELQNTYLDLIAPHITDPQKDNLARLEWLDTYNTSLTVDAKEGKDLIGDAMTSIINKYGAENYYDNSFDDEL
jgi:hypothetical protein